jgi:hypothetical protein
MAKKLLNIDQYFITSRGRKVRWLNNEFFSTHQDSVEDWKKKWWSIQLSGRLGLYIQRRDSLQCCYLAGREVWRHMTIRFSPLRDGRLNHPVPLIRKAFNALTTDHYSFADASARWPIPLAFRLGTSTLPKFSWKIDLILSSTKRSISWSLKPNLKCLSRIPRRRDDGAPNSYAWDPIR